VRVGGGGGEDGCSGDLHQRSMREQLHSIEYARVVVFMALHVLHFNFYVGTFVQQITSIAQRDPSVTPAPETGTEWTVQQEDDVNQRINTIVQSFSLWLGILMPSAILIIPLVGRILDTLPLRHGGFLACNVSGSMWSLLAMVPSLPLQWLTILVLSAHRVTLFSCLFAYTANRFGPSHFGSLIGVTMLVSSLVGLLQYPLAVLAEIYGYAAIHLLFLLVLLPLFVLKY